ncbi:MAG: hypothetical protein ACKVZ0_16100 [Gemmatimonadales bacterium]
MANTLQIVKVTLGLVVAGIVVGAACGVAALGILGVLSGESPLRDGLPLAVAAAFGAAVGAVAAPAFSWLLLRYVPLGKAILHCAIGTVVGGVLGFAIPSIHLGSVVVPAVLYAPVVGFLAAAVRLRLVTPSRPREQLDLPR